MTNLISSNFSLIIITILHLVLLILIVLAGESNRLYIFSTVSIAAIGTGCASWATYLIGRNLFLALLGGLVYLLFILMMYFVISRRTVRSYAFDQIRAD